MENQELIELANSITNVSKQRKNLYSLLDALSISYKPTSCTKCLKDYLNIAKEELGIIGDASEESDFNGCEDCEYVYLLDREQSWNGHMIGRNTPKSVIEAFIAEFPKGYYSKVEKAPEIPTFEKTDTDMNNVYLGGLNAVQEAYAETGLTVPVGVADASQNTNEPEPTPDPSTNEQE